MITQSASLIPVNVSIRGILKFIFFIGLILAFIVHHGIISLLIKDKEKRNKFFLKSIKRYAKLSHLILNIQIHHIRKKDGPQGSLIVANHMSYIDVLVLSAIYPSLFITSVEIRETFLLGQVCRLAGCFHVERRKNKIVPGTKEKEVLEMKKQLDNGFNVFLFPEGTSSNGLKVLPFKATFFQLAEDGIPVVPICLRYTGESQSTVPWYGSMTFAWHLYKLCESSSINAEVEELDSIRGKNKFELASHTQMAISECYG